MPFVLEGLGAEQPVMVAVTPAHLALLRDGLGGDADQVRFVDMFQLGANPARIIPAWRAFTEEHTPHGREVRGIGEPIWHGRRPAEVAECQLHEALLNVAVAPETPFWLLCPYDVGALPEDVIAEAHRSHPVVVDVERHPVGTAHGGDHQAGVSFEMDLPEVEVAVSHRDLRHGDLAAVRADVTAHALSCGLTPDRAADLALAVHEVALNALQHGGTSAQPGHRGELRIWEEDRALVCEVRGPGRIHDPMAGRRDPAWHDEGGRGLWMANQLADLVQIRSGRSGTTVRLHSWL